MQPKDYRAEIWTRKVPVTPLAHLIAHYGVITKMQVVEGPASSGWSSLSYGRLLACRKPKDVLAANKRCTALTALSYECLVKATDFMSTF